jgi:LmbE family N-acetylglucosaminyl deacetylase
MMTGNGSVSSDRRHGIWPLLVPGGRRPTLSYIYPDLMGDPSLDILAIAAHRDDVEQTCGGTLLKMAGLGHRTGILDLTRGEMGTRGSAEEREREAFEASRILQVSWRQALDIPDGRVENTWANRLKVARAIRQTRPRVVILPYWKGRHPDHYTASKLGYEGCFLAGLAKLNVERALSDQGSAFSQVASSVASVVAGESQGGGHMTSAGSAMNRTQTTAAAAQGIAHRPFKIIYATLYYDIRPTFVVDITDQFEARFESLMAYKSQFSDQEAGRDIFPARAEIRARIEAMARFYGMLAGVTYAEPFMQKEVGLVEDVMAIPVKSI